MLIVTHIAKTGGTSFLHYLQEIYGPALHHHHQPPRQAPLFWMLKLVRRAGIPALTRLVRSRLIDCVDVPVGTACIFGHFRATHFDRAFPRARHAVWLRDPVERVVSNYHYFQRIGDRRNRYHRLIVDDGLSLADFAALPRMRNRQTDHLDGKPLSRFDFVGITEEFATGLRLFARLFDYPPPDTIPLANRNRQRSQVTYDLPSDLREHLRHLNAEDERTYAEGRQRFAALCHANGLDLAGACAAATDVAGSPGRIISYQQPR